MGEKRWYIFQENEKPQLLTAASIRAALRKGDIDPFDIVCPEDAPDQKGELVNFPEIFRDKADKAKEKAEGSFQTHQKMASENDDLARDQGDRFEAEKSESFQLAQVRSKTKKPSKPSELDLGLTPYQQASSSEEHTSARVAKKPIMKNFFLERKDGKKMGPLSATEIQSLFYRGVLPNSVKVLKSGSERKIKIRQFVAAYADSRLKSIANKQLAVKNPAKASKVMPSSRVINELYRVVSARKLAKKTGYVRLAMAGLFVLAAAYMVYFFLWHKPVSASRGGPSQLRSGIHRSLLIEAKRKEKKPAKKTNRKPVISKKVVAQKKKTASKIIVSKKNQTRPKALGVKAKDTHTLVSLRRMGSFIGRNITVGPLFFSKRALSVCEAKCTLRFVDKNQNRLRVQFFKSAFQGALVRGKSGVYLSGTLVKDGDGLVLRLSGVK